MREWHGRTVLRYLGALVWLPFVMLVGCQFDTSNRCSVQGNVTLDGAPLPKGFIVFLPEPTAKTPMSAGLIQQGTFHIKATDGPGAGKHKIEIWPASRRDVAADKHSAIPSKYNEFTTLSVTMSEEQTNQFDFQLFSTQ